MTSPIQIMNEEEVRRCCRVVDEDQSFGSLSTAKGHLPLRAMNVSARITGLAAEVTLEQTFENTLAEPIEATYIFPLPDRSGVTRFRMEVNGRITEGEIKERGQARREYTEAIRTGHRAAITEEERPGVFTMRVGNLMPGERANILLQMTGPIPFDDGEATFRFPLVVAPRYIPGLELAGQNVGDGVASDTDAVPDASRISPPVLLPGYPNPVRLAFTVELDPAGLPISDLRSALHAVIASSAERGVQRIQLQAGERLNRDFVLRFKLGTNAVKTSLVLRPDVLGDQREGTFLMTLVPPAHLPEAPKPRDVVFVLDRSGSMGGWKMVAARRAVARMVDTLREKDSFSVFAFDDQIETPPSFNGTALVQATDRNRFRAVEFLAQVEARGGTEMAQPLDTGVKMLAGGYHDRERVLVLVTDGQVGNEDQILKRLGSQVKNLRIFTLGIDRAVNEGFLKRLAALGGGLAEIVESEDRLDEVMDKIHRRIGTPIVTELAVIPSGMEVVQDSIVPSRIPDLFAGAPVFISGRYRGTSRGELTITGRDALGRAYSELVRSEMSSSAAITTIWARGQVRELEDRFVAGKGDKGQLERRIVETSLRFGVLCRFTAFLAVDKSEIVNRGGHTAKVTQPVEAPEGWAMFEDEKAKMPPMAMGGLARGRGGPGAFNGAFGGAAGGPMPPPPPSPAPMQARASRMIMDKLEAEDDLDESASIIPAAESIPMSRPMSPMSPPKPSPARAPEPMKKRAKSSSSGALGQVFKALTGRKEAQSETERDQSGIDLDSYRRRAKEMLDRLRDEASQAITHGARLAALGILAAHLRTLVEDLRSVGASSGIVDPLANLLGELRNALMSSQLGESEAVALWMRAETTLDTFAGAVTATTGERADFWK